MAFPGRLAMAVFAAAIVGPLAYLLEARLPEADPGPAPAAPDMAGEALAAVLQRAFTEAGLSETVTAAAVRRAPAARIPSAEIAAAASSLTAFARQFAAILDDPAHQAGLLGWLDWSLRERLVRRPGEPGGAQAARAQCLDLIAAAAAAEREALAAVLPASAREEVLAQCEAFAAALGLRLQALEGDWLCTAFQAPLDEAQLGALQAELVRPDWRRLLPEGAEDRRPPAVIGRQVAINLAAYGDAMLCYLYWHGIERQVHAMALRDGVHYGMTIAYGRWPAMIAMQPFPTIDKEAHR